MSIRLPVLASECSGPRGVWMKRLISVLLLRSVSMVPSDSPCPSGRWRSLLEVTCGSVGACACADVDVCPGGESFDGADAVTETGADAKAGVKAGT